MIIAFSAAQGQGKTTLINDIMKHSRYKSDMSQYPTKSARTIITNYGGDLQKIYNDRDMLCNFQLDILKLHKEIFNYSYNTKFLLVERSFMDILAFTVLNLGRFNDLTDWLTNFATSCHDNQQNIKYTVKLQRSLIPKNDGVRPINNLFNEAYDLYLLRLISKYDTDYIWSADRMERVDAFDQHIQRKI